MDPHITLSDVRRAKRMAKTARRASPFLTHQQHLDEIARREFGVRDYHELGVLHKKSMERYLSPEGGATRCRYCGFLLVPEYEEDRKQHDALHEAYEQAYATLGFLPSQYAEREKRKREGYNGIHSENEHTRQEAALLLMFSYFERSLDAAIQGDYWKTHPYFNQYARELAPVANFLPDDLRAWLTNKFGPPQTTVVLAGTYWPATLTRSKRAA